jgi:hypothetical protein
VSVSGAISWPQTAADERLIHLDFASERVVV